ncbi:cob(I)yrinic acid a,c-diamide adenosyltransferase [Tessaracoccus sp. OH4464_COT-324]|uniref:cob(I)yrinic acid a,c-diamide adenosyltransferase n=1 Tax=Tessaracoccus sp. OH4464_COT-324 TaxID=2491059 RepID=UPI000F63E457|nr:cob(I)yrinic acid a,c-diamide adenosyltransferase [Tessaracoccus sp. OH4464_COT-324]RRD47794.1 cob(I)yrinic acid a,c-diamide adenosyltransferase [Tessaracoccus sp. OH4464_COT-324]
MPAIYTRTGDAGDTGLFGGSRVAKDSLRVEAYGAVDEANSALGAAKTLLPEGDWRDRVHRIQHRLFVLAAELASDEAGAAKLDGRIDAHDIVELENLIDDCLAVTGPQRAFVVPGRDTRSAVFHVARTIVRRAERRTLTLSAHEQVRAELIKFLNRLSDAVYALARLSESWADAQRIEAIVRKAVKQHLTVLPNDTVLTRAQLLVARAQDKARALGVPVAVAVVDAGGGLVAFERMSDTLLASTDIALNKAWTAAAFKQTTANLGEAASTVLPGLADGNQGRVVLFGGGFPLFDERGHLLGGLGVSGGTVEEDCLIAEYALAWTNAQGDEE